MPSIHLAPMAALCLLAGCGGSGGGAGCPSEAELRAAIEKGARQTELSDTNRMLYRTRDLQNFRFAKITFGAVTDQQVTYGAAAQPTCPARLEYSFERVNEDGEKSEGGNKGEGTYYFFKDGFGEWTYKVG